MRMNLPRLFGTHCKHETVMVVRTAGMERMVCESCGHVSFSFDQYDLVSAELAPDASIGADTD
ncbi:MAG: hypothetical protein M3P87_07785 [Actinomycetota bacterium]|nr:hypothetical protein [Actinomycetota bacterium]